MEVSSMDLAMVFLLIGCFFGAMINIEGNVKWMCGFIGLFIGFLHKADSTL